MQKVSVFLYASSFCLLLALIAASAAPLSAQASSQSAEEPAEEPAPSPPGTEIFLVEIDRAGETLQLGTPRNVSQRPGYDNQPLFSPDGKRFFYTAIADGQADLWAYDLADQKRIRLTDTAASEYSPTPVPGGDAITFIHQDTEGVQLLGRLSLDAPLKKDAVPAFPFPEIKPVGYHVWNGDGMAAFFVLGEPPTLQTARPGPGEGKVLAENIGRALKRVPGSNDVAFVHKQSEENWMIRRVNLETGKISDLLQTPTGREDFVFGPRGEIWIGDGSLLLKAAPGASEWSVVADLEEHGIRGITRLDVHPDGDLLVFVAEE